MRCYKQDKEQGFTLIELLIAMALALIIIAALSGAFISQRKTLNTQDQVSEMIQGARAAMEMIAHEIKMAGFDPTDSGNFSIPYNSNTSIIDIYADVKDGDGSVTTSWGSMEHITYSKAAGENIIRRNTNTGGGAQPFAENIQSFTVNYYKADGTPTTTAADIRQIRITIEARTAEEDPDYTHPIYGNGYRTYTLTSRVTPPNLDF
jgi:type IV pilus assembly protein PilW